MQDAGEEVTEDEELQWYLQRLDGGLFTLQHTDYILAWIMMEDDGIRVHAQKMLARNNLSLQDIISTLQIYHDNVDEDEQGSSTQRDILNNLIAVLTELV
jgi:beta-catenin-like protein 1